MLFFYLLTFRPVTGRYVSIFKAAHGQLVICEFEVYGKSVHQQNGKYESTVLENKS